MLKRKSDVFCDWLDVTCSPDDSFISRLHDFLDSLGCPVAFTDNDRTVVEVGSGKLILDEKKRFHRASASGMALSHLRIAGAFEQYLSLLSEVPHNVTRLDAALDVGTDAPSILRSLEARYPTDFVSLSRKSLRVTRFYSARTSDGQLTGTWYVGHRSRGRVTARVYDKQAEILHNQGIESSPRTRYELTFRKDLGCTLRDAFMPASLFYQYASPTLLDAPEGVPDWEPNASFEWKSSPSDLLPFELFARRVETSPELARLAELSARFGETGRSTLLRVFTEQLDRELRNSQGSDARRA